MGILWCPHCKTPHVLGTKVCPLTAKTIERDLRSVSERDRLHPLIGTTIAGKYRVVRLIGQGAIAEVFEAENKLRRPVAVKVVRASTVENAAARLEREAELVSTIQHPNICDVYDSGALPDGSPFIVLERLSGETLHVQLRRPQRIPLAGVLDIFTQMLSGLQAAHGANIVHRDLKPKNVFLVDRLGCAPIVKLLDFGFGKDLFAHYAETLTAPGRAVGTVPYMAPEQIRGEPASVRSDLFAVAIMLYEALTGKHPFEGEGLLAIRENLLRCEPASPALFRPDLPRPLVEVVERSLQRDPENRWDTAVAFQKALREAFAESPRRWNESLLPDSVPESQVPSSRREH